MTSVDANDIKSDDEDKDQPEHNLSNVTNENECTEADADLSVHGSMNQDIISNGETVVDVKKDSNENIASDRTEADEETEAQLKEKVKGKC